MPSHWVLLARREQDLGTLTSDRRWHVFSPRPYKTLWTDHFSNIFIALKCVHPGCPPPP